MAVLLTGSASLHACDATPQPPPRPPETLESKSVQPQMDPEEANVAPSRVAIPEEPSPELLKATLAAPEVQAYLHPDAPGRKPLVVATTDFVHTPFEVLGHPIVLKSPELARSDGGPFLEVVAVSVDGEQGTLTFRFEVEGISGKAALELRDGRWRPQTVSIVEN